MIERADVIGRIRQLPTLPRALLDLQQALSDPDVSVSRVEQLIRSDPSLAANTLRFANSAAFGLSRQVTDIAQAITLVGLRMLANLAHTAAFSKAIPSDFPGYHITADEFLRHSYAVGVMAESLMRATQAPPDLPYFTAGLLHDVGKLVLGTFVATHDEELSRRLQTESLSFVRLERDVLGVDHGEVAAWVAEHWRLPPELIDPARFHHTPSQATTALQPVVDVVHVADMAAHCLGFGADLGELARSIDQGACSRLEISAEVLEAAVSASLERLVSSLPTGSAGAEAAPSAGRVLRILVVDDSSIIRQMVCKSLSLAGLPAHETLQAKDGVEAMALLRSETAPCSLVLADLHMPRMTGTDLVAAMAEDERLKHIPVVIISSDGNSANHERLRHLGVRALVKKPFRPEHLRSVVQPILNAPSVPS